jgi:hypothetical protein
MLELRNLEERPKQKKKKKRKPCGTRCCIQKDLHGPDELPEEQLMKRNERARGKNQPHLEHMPHG